MFPRFDKPQQEDAVQYYVFLKDEGTCWPA